MEQIFQGVLLVLRGPSVHLKHFVEVLVLWRKMLSSLTSKHTSDVRHWPADVVKLALVVLEKKEKDLRKVRSL